MDGTLRPVTPEAMVDIHAAAAHLGLSIQWLYIIAQRGEVPSYIVGIGKRAARRFKLSELDAWAKAKAEAVAADHS